MVAAIEKGGRLESWLEAIGTWRFISSPRDNAPGGAVWRIAEAVARKAGTRREMLPALTHS